MTSSAEIDGAPTHWRRTRVEFVAALGTYLTLSYVFLLNPILLSRAGIDLSAAFFATAVSAGIATLLMGLVAKLPYAVAPAPSITTFFVSYVCLTLGLSWQAALAAVIVSGVLSVAMAFITIRERFISDVPRGLKVGVLFAIAGFMVSNGLSQAKLASAPKDFIGLPGFNLENLFSANALIFATGLGVSILFSIKKLKFSGAPLFGILAATAVATYFGLRASTPATWSREMFSAVGQFDFGPLLDWRFGFAMVVFFIIDFFGGVAKFMGLDEATPERDRVKNDPRLKKALYVDGIGNGIGGLLGASSLAVFISSVVGVRMGARTGRTAIFVAGMMFLSLLYMPLVGNIPVEAISGVIAFIGLILLPLDKLTGEGGGFASHERWIWLSAALLGLLTFGIDKGILLVFVAYSVMAFREENRFRRKDAILHAMSLLMGAAVAVQLLH